MRQIVAGVDAQQMRKRDLAVAITAIVVDDIAARDAPIAITRPDAHGYQSVGFFPAGFSPIYLH